MKWEHNSSWNNVDVKIVYSLYTEPVPLADALATAHRGNLFVYRDRYVFHSSYLSGPENPLVIPITATVEEAMEQAIAAVVAARLEDKL